MAGQKPAAAEKNESANPVLRINTLKTTMELTQIYTPGRSIKDNPRRRKPFAEENGKMRRIPESSG